MEGEAAVEDVEQDSLTMTDSSDKTTEANLLDEEIAKAFEEADNRAEDAAVQNGDDDHDLDNLEDKDQEEGHEPDTVMSASRASSVSFFVDLNDATNKMCRSAIATPRNSASVLRSRSARSGERMTQSMYVRSDSQSSGISFFVDINPTSNGGGSRMIHSMSREEAAGDLGELSEDMRAKSRLLLAKNLDQTKTFFKKLKSYVDFLASPSYSKDELRQKRRMAEDISRLMFVEEQKLKKGETLSSMAELDRMILGQSGGLKQRPISAYVAGSGSGSMRSQFEAAGTSGAGEAANNSHNERPILRRERTFDLDQNQQLPLKSKLVEVNIDADSSKAAAGEGDENGIMGDTNLLMFQQQRLFHTMRLKREIAKLEKMERDLAERSKAMVVVSKPEPKPRQCWTDQSSSSANSSRANSARHHGRANGDTSSRPKRPARTRDDKKEAEAVAVKTTTFTRQKRTSDNKPRAEVLNGVRPDEGHGHSLTFKDLKEHHHQHHHDLFRVNMSDSMDSNNSSFSWFIPSDHDASSPPTPAPRHSKSAQANIPRPHTSGGGGGLNDDPRSNRSRGIQTGRSLLRQYQEKKDKAVYVRDRPQAYFIECDDSNKTADPASKKHDQPPAQPPPQPTARSRTRSHHNNNNNVQTTIIDLETDSLPDEKNLQEALKKNRPDYIAKSKTREMDRLAKSYVNSTKSSVPKAKQVYGGSSSTTNSRPTITKSNKEAAASKIPKNTNLPNKRGIPETVTIHSRPRSSKQQPATAIVNGEAKKRPASGRRLNATSTATAAPRPQRHAIKAAQ